MSGGSIKNSTMKKIKVSISTIISLFLMFTSIFQFGSPIKTYAAAGFFLEGYYSQDSVTAGDGKQIVLVASDRNFNGIKTLTITGYENTKAGAGTITYLKDNMGGMGTVDLDASGTTTVQAYFASNPYSLVSGTIVSTKLNKAGNSRITYSVNGAYTDTAYVVKPASANKLAMIQDIAAPTENGDLFETQPIMEIQDVYGNRCTNSSNMISVSKNDSGQWNLTGTLSISAANGLIKFSDLKAESDELIDNAQLKFTCAGFIGAFFSCVKLPAKTFTVTFKDYDGTILKTQKVNYGCAATAPANPSRAGYVFTGWDKCFDRITSNTVVTAQYRPACTYTVIFKDYDGTVLKTQYVSYGGAATAPPNPTRPGYTFVGWDKCFNRITCNTVVTALYRPACTFTVIFKDYDGTVLKTQYVGYGDAATAPANPSRTGYTFIGWDKCFSRITCNTVVTALYRINTYKVIFKDYDGTILKTQCVAYGGAATAPANPTRAGYTFTGWDKPFDKITEDIVITAQYRANCLTVIFKDYDGKILKTQTVSYGGAATAPANPSRTGYTFTGWDRPFDNITADTVVTAVYNINTYAVTFKDYNGTVLKTESVNYGGAATAPANPSRTGYTFIGWDKAFDKIIADTTVTAQYNINTYKVTFKDYDGTILKTESVNYNCAATAPAVPVREGYTFTGWDKAFDKVTADTTVTAQYTINKYIVTFKDYDGTVLKAETVNYGGAATAPASPNREGYTFAGWDKSFDKITADTTVTAQYNINSYKVIFKDYDGTILKTDMVDYGNAATAPANPGRTGYTFTGWDKAFDKITEDTTVTAQYTINSYKVIFKDYNGIELKTESVNYGSAATAPENPSRTGYSFTGWDKSFDKITEDTVVTAQYKINTYTVVFKDYDGTTLKEEKVDYGNGATAPAVPGRTGYSFTGWDKAFDNITEDVTITAQYIINTYKVTFKDYDGTDLKTEVVEYGSGATAPADPSRTGYTFTGWDKAFANITEDTVVTAQYSINTYTVIFVDYNGATLKKESVNYGSAAEAPADPSRTGYTFTGWDKPLGNITEDTTITAQYTINTYSVIFKDCDGTILSTQSVNYGGAATAPASPSRTGYTFSGWDKAFDNITENTVITAQYNINSYTVTFKDYDGTTLKEEKVDYGSDATAPTVPGRTGYTFTGWDKNFNNITEDTTVTAQYTINIYTVTFKDYDGNTLKTQNVNYGGAATAPANPSRTGYTFTGWDKAFDNITADTTVTAQYKINTYTVTFKNDDGTVLKTQSVSYGSGATAPIVPGRLYYSFTGWDKPFDNVTEDITTTAQFARVQYTLTVINGTGSGTYDADTVVTAVPIVPEGKYFAGWVDETGSIIRYCNPYNFIITDNKTLTAIFSDTPVDKVPNISLDDEVVELNVSYSSGKMYFISTVSVPPPYQLVECGVVVSRTVNTDLTKANADAALVSTTQNEVGQFYSIFNVTYGHTLYARSYVTYKDANGTLITKYSINTVEATQTIQ